MSINSLARSVVQDFLGRLLWCHTQSHMTNCDWVRKAAVNELENGSEKVDLYSSFSVDDSNSAEPAKRSCSSLCRLKTYLRSTMTNCRLNNLLLLYVHNDRTDKLDLCKIAKEFASLNERRVNYLLENLIN